MSSNSQFRVNQRIRVTDKGTGTIAFIGKTQFADGNWIGVILDEPNGNHNGTVQKKDGTFVRYFTCEENHGIYIQSKRIESVLDASSTDASSSNLSHRNGVGTGSVKSNKIRITPELTSTRPAVSYSNIQSTHDSLTGSTIVTAEEESTPAVLSPTRNSITMPCLLLTESIDGQNETVDYEQIVSNLKSKIKDQDEQIQTLVKLRRDELEKIKMFKSQNNGQVRGLAEKLEETEKKLKETELKFSAYRDEMSDTELQIESITLDLQIAEEKLEIKANENAHLKGRLEEVELELEILQGEIQVNGMNHVANGIQKKVEDERTIKMEQALIKLRDFSMHQKTENSELKQKLEQNDLKYCSVKSQNENLKADIDKLQSTIADLHDQIDTYLHTQQMVDQLTSRNLFLEDQVRELQETVENLESLCEVDREMEENAKEIEQELRQDVDTLQTQVHDKERHIEKLQYTIADYERTILKFRQALRNIQKENEEYQQKIEKYEEQLKAVGSIQSNDFKTKVLQKKSYSGWIDGELKNIECIHLIKQSKLLHGFLPEIWTKRGSDYDCLLLVILFPRLISKCDLLSNEIEKKFTRLSQLKDEDVLKTHRAEQWSFACKLLQSILAHRLIIYKYNKIVEICSATTLRQLGNVYADFATHEKSIDILIELLKKDKIYDSTSLNILDKGFHFYQNFFENHLLNEKFSASVFLYEFTRLVIVANDALDIDIQRLNILQRIIVDGNPMALLIENLFETNERIRHEAIKISRVTNDQDETNQVLQLPCEQLSSINCAILNLDQLTKTFHEICSHLSTRILMFDNAHERLRIEDLENIAYQACDKIYKVDDRGPYDSLRDSMNEVLRIMTQIRIDIEQGSYHTFISNIKQPIYEIGEHLRISINEMELMRYRLEKKDEEMTELKKILKEKHEEISESNLRLMLNEKRYDSLQKESDEKLIKHKEIIEEIRLDAQQKIRNCEEALNVLQNDNEQLEQENGLLKERLKQFNKSKITDDLVHLKKYPDSMNNMNLSSFARRILVEDHEIETLKNTIRLLKDELWQLKLNQTSNELRPLSVAMPTTSKNDFVEICQQSTILMNDLFSTIANYRITGEHVEIKQNLLRSKLKLVDHQTSNLQQKIHEFENELIPGSIVSSPIKYFPQRK